MSRLLSHAIVASALLIACGAARADDPIVLVWSTIAGGGGASSADGFDLLSTVGQSDVSGVLTDGTFTLYNGYSVPPSANHHSRCVGDLNRY
ncbi:MAG: hypothetical protein AABZ53_10410, partial [Planctomycetota bacterium]